MEMKHTPGPWEHWIGGSTWGITGPSGAAASCAENAVRESLILNDCTVIFIAAKNNVAPALAFGDTKEEAKANAKLIAAAPDLLEALNQCRGCDLDPKTRSIVDAAIKKATQ